MHARAVLVMVLFVCVACANGDVVEQHGALPFAALAPARADPDAPDGLSLDARIVGSARVAVADRPVVVVDARGHRTEMRTNDGGAVHLEGVAPPYDLLVGPNPEGAPLVTTAVLGSRMGAPMIQLDEGTAPLARPSLRLAVQRPDCESCRRSPCRLRAVSRSEGGDGSGEVFFLSSGVAILSWEHSWRTVAPIDVDLLVDDEEKTCVAAGHLARVAVEAGTASDLGMARVDLVPARGPIPVAFSGTSSDAEHVTTWLEFASGGALPLSFGVAERSFVFVPQVSGAFLRVEGTSASTAGDAEHARTAWSGRLPLDAPSVQIDSVREPTARIPAPRGTMERSASRLAWEQLSGSHLYVLALVHAARTEAFTRLLTSESEVPFSRLEALGIGRPNVGSHWFDLTTFDGLTLDDVLGGARVAPDPSHPGHRTNVRFSFQVAP